MEEGNVVNHVGGHHRRDLWPREVVDVVGREAAVEQRDAVKIKVGGGEEEVNDGAGRPKAAKKADPDANAGSDYDAMPVEDGGEDVPPPELTRLSIPNSVFRPARILVNPRCPTTYAGVKHTQLARDLFGEGDDDALTATGKYVLDDWEGAPESFVCQEQRCVIYWCLGRVNDHRPLCFTGKQVVGARQKHSAGLGFPYTMNCIGYPSDFIGLRTLCLCIILVAFGFNIVY